MSLAAVGFQTCEKVVVSATLAAMQSKNRGWMVLALFFGSGATALVYEVVWAKFLAQMFGSTIYAQTVVLAVFMGGLALGNRIFGGWADGLQRPVKAYGVLEILIGIYAFLFPMLERVTDRIFIATGSPIVEHAGWLLALKGILSAALLLGPTILMGGTLPLLAAWLHQQSADAGRRSARFYSVNSLGAVTGRGASRVLAGAALRHDRHHPDHGHGKCAHRCRRHFIEPKRLAGHHERNVRIKEDDHGGNTRHLKHPVLGGPHGGADRRCFHGFGNSGVALVGADLWFIAAIFRRRFDRVYSRHRTR